MTNLATSNLNLNDGNNSKLKKQKSEAIDAKTATITGSNNKSINQTNASTNKTLINNAATSINSNDDDSSQNGSKLTGPVNGNECYFWRTTGCLYAEKCRYEHIKKNKGCDKKPWHK